MQLPYLPVYNYGNGAVSWTPNIATRLASLSHKLVRMVFQKLQGRFLDWFMLSSEIDNYHHRYLFGSHLRFSGVPHTLAKVAICYVTYCIALGLKLQAFLKLTTCCNHFPKILPTSADLKAGCIGNNGKKNWQLSPGTSSQTWKKRIQ